MSDSVAARKTYGNRPPVVETHPDKVWMFVDQEMTERLTASSGKRTEFRCADGHRWEAVVNNIITKGRGCPYCSGRRALIGFNDITTTHPERVAMFADPEMAKRFTAASDKRAEFKCDAGHRWEATVGNVVTEGCGCPYCSSRRVLAGFNDIATTHPLRARMFVDQLLPTTLNASSGKRAEFRCLEGHLWWATVCNVIAKGGDCPYCSGHRVLAGFNDISTTHPNRVSLFIDKELPKKLTAWSHKRAEFQCPVGHRWSTIVSHVIGGGGGCPTCAKTGFDRSKPAFLYIVDRQGLGPVLGISNRLDWRRLYSYADDNNEIRVITCFLSCDGGLIADAERWLIACFCTPAPRDAECFDGCARESFDSPLDVPAAVAMMRADGRFAEFIPAIDRGKYKIIDCSQEIS